MDRRVWTESMRKNIIDKMKDYKPDPAEEFRKIYDWLHKSEYLLDDGTTISAYEELRRSFIKFPQALRGTFLSIEEMEEKLGYNFAERYDAEISIDDLVDLCEYVSTLLLGYYNCPDKGFMCMSTTIIKDYDTYSEHVFKVMEKSGYTRPVVTIDERRIRGLEPVYYIPVAPEVSAVLECVEMPEDLQWRMLMYDHHSSRGDLFAKKNVIRDCADLLEPQKNKLAKIDVHFKKDLFCLFNNINIRHNNADLAIDDKEQEHWYDITYRMCLIAFLLLEHELHKAEIKELRKKLEQK